MNGIEPSNQKTPIYSPPPIDTKEEAPSLCNRIWLAYCRIVQSLVDCLRSCKLNNTAAVLGTLLIEPWQAIKAGFHSWWYSKKDFTYYGLNPTSITEQQSKKAPILLLHGDLHDQTAWLNFAQKCKEFDLGPLYTMNLPHRTTPIEETNGLIETKITEIRAQYQSHGNHDIKIHLVGHSRGGERVCNYAWTESGNILLFGKKDHIGKVISIGRTAPKTVLEKIKAHDPDYHHRFLEITGHYDILHSDTSFLPNQARNWTGHLGLIYSEETFDHIHRFLK